MASLFHPWNRPFESRDLIASLRVRHDGLKERMTTTMKAIARFAPATARILLGLVFFVFGLNGFLQLLPQPPLPDSAAAFLGALAATGYMFPLIKGVEVIGGALLLSNRFVPLALAILAPNVVNILLFHAVLAPGGLPVAVLILALEIFTAWSYRDAYASMLRARSASKVTSSAGHAAAAVSGSAA
jgi:uncharacterized membrane protein YphA (DoxX/SURF4 family)